MKLSKKMPVITILSILLCFLLPSICSGSEYIYYVNSTSYHETAGTWAASGLLGYAGSPSRYSASSSASASWKPGVIGQFDVEFYTIKYAGNSQNVKIEVRHKTGTDYIILDQLNTNTGFVSIGAYEFTGSQYEGVFVTSMENGTVRTNVVRFTSTTIQADTTVYVSTAGSDANDGSQQSPVATIKKAWEIAKKSTVGASNIIISGGTYNLEVPIEITKSNVSIKAAVGENVTISGGRTVTDFTQHSGQIYKASVGTDIDFRQIYIDGERAIRARYPNEGQNLTFEREKDSNGFYVSDSIPSVSNYQNKLELSCYADWMHKRFRVSNITTTAYGKYFTINTIEKDALTKPQGITDYLNREYWVENAYEFIDAPYEWYFDKTTGYLYVYQPVGMNLNNVTVTIPVSDGLFMVKGIDSYYVNNISFEDLSFKYTNWTRPNEYGFVDIQGNLLVPSPNKYVTDAQFRQSFRKEKVKGALGFDCSEGITIKNCVFSKIGGSGINMELGGSNSQITGNVFHDISSSGIDIGTDCYLPSESKMIPHNLVVNNNYIYNVGVEYHGAVALIVFFSENVLVEHNHIENVAYSGINVSWGWDPPQAASTTTGNFTVRRNLVTDYASKTIDVGGIYTPNPSIGTNVIENNYLRGNYKAMTDSMIFGLYHDGNCANWTDSTNVVENVNNWVVAGTAYTSKRDIAVLNTFINVDIQGAKISPNDDNIYHQDTVQINEYAWPSAALSIINSAGLESQYVNIKNKISDEITYDVEPRITFLGYKETKNIPVKIKNNFNYPVTINLSSHSQNQSVVGINQNVSFVAGEEKTVNLSITQDTEAGLLDEKIIATVNGREYIINTAVNANKYSDQDHFFNTSSDSFEMVAGDWQQSSLFGPLNTRSVFGSTSSALAKWTPEISGFFNVNFFNIQSTGSATNAKIEIRHKNGVYSIVLDQVNTPTSIVDMGNYEFSGAADEGVYISYNNAVATGVLRACGVEFINIEHIYDTTSDAFETVSGTWQTSTLLGPKNLSSIYGSTSNALAKWTPDIIGNFNVRFFTVQYANSATNAKIEVRHKYGIAAIVLDQANTPTSIVDLGSFEFSGAPDEGVYLSYNNYQVTGVLRACAVNFIESSKYKLFDTASSVFEIVSGTWGASAVLGPKGTASIYGSTSNALAKWTPQLAGNYNVTFFNIQNAASATNAKVEVRHKNGIDSIVVNQQTTPTSIISLGNYEFSGAAEEGVYLSFDNSLYTGYLRACGVEFKR